MAAEESLQVEPNLPSPRHNITPRQASLVPQRDHRIDLACPARWDVTRDDRDSQKQSRYTHKSQWVKRFDAIQQRLHIASYAQCRSNTNGCSEQSQPCPPPDDETHDAALLGAQRHSYADLMLSP